MTLSPERAREQLLEIYRRLDDALLGFGCGASTACCRFGVTGREPYVTKVERHVLERAIAKRGGLPKRKTLPIAEERVCPLLGDDGRCGVYEARPFGCRTFFCGDALRDYAPGKLPRATIGALVRDLSDLSEKYDPRDGRGAPLTRSFGRRT